MRELHVVAVSEDGRHVVLATRKGALKGEFRVPLDERLSAAVRGDLPRPGEAEPAVVTPKEIQSRLRAGESPEQIAASAGVPVSKIDRYAGPVLSERDRVVNQARAGFVTRSRLGESALPLGEAVDRHLAETTGVRLETVSWSARREESGSWLVELSYVSQARQRGAIWRYDGVRREVTAVDALAATLAHVEATGRRSRAADPEPFSVPAARTGSRPAARRAAPVRAAKTPKAPVARTVAARPATPPVRAAAPVPRAAAPTKAAETAATRAAAATAARATTARAAAQERAAQAAAAEATRAAAQAQEAADAQARAAQERAAQQAEEQAATASAARAAKAAAAKAAKDKAAAQKAAKERAAQARAEKAAADQAAKQAAREQAAADQAAADQAADQAAADQAAREAEPAPTGPPTLRVVGAQDAPAPARRGPKEPPAAARTAPARVAGQRASVPGWADVLLSTAPLARPEAEPDAD